MSNYVIDTSDAIEYEMKTTENGWNLCVKVPAETSISDQSVVLDWVHGYQREVKKLHPHWLTAFRKTEFGYVLVMQRADGVHEMLRAVGLMQSGDRVRDYWNQSLEYAG